MSVSVYEVYKRVSGLLELALSVDTSSPTRALRIEAEHIERVVHF